MVPKLEHLERREMPSSMSAAFPTTLFPFTNLFGAQQTGKAHHHGGHNNGEESDSQGGGKGGKHGGGD